MCHFHRFWNKNKHRTFTVCRVNSQVTVKLKGIVSYERKRLTSRSSCAFCTRSANIYKYMTFIIFTFLLCVLQSFPTSMVTYCIYLWLSIWWSQSTADVNEKTHILNTHIIHIYIYLKFHTRCIFLFISFHFTHVPSFCLHYTGFYFFHITIYAISNPINNHSSRECYFWFFQETVSHSDFRKTFFCVTRIMTILKKKKKTPSKCLDLLCWICKSFEA